MQELAAAEIAGLLSRLVDKSLVQLDADGRFSFLQLVRSFAQEELMRSADSGPTRSRHLDFYHNFSKAQGDGMFGSEPIKAVKAFESEVDNVRVALEWAITNPTTWHLGTEMFNDICHFMSDHGWFVAGEALMEAAIQNSPGSDEYGVASALAWLAVFQHAQLNHSAEETCQRAIEFGNRSDNAIAITRGLSQLADIRCHENNLAESEALAEQALVHARAGNLKRSLGGILVMLGNLALLSGRLDRAKDFYLQAREHCISIGNRRGLPSAQGNLGHVNERLGDYEEAFRNYREAAKIFYDLDSFRNLAGSLAGCSIGFWLTGEDETAAMMLGAADKLCEDLKTYLDEVDSETAERSRARLLDRMGEQAFVVAVQRGRAEPLEEIMRMLEILRT